MASRLNPTNFGYQNFYSALLTADITSSTTTISVDTVPTPTSGILVIEPDSTTNREVILYTSKGASTIVCPSDGRGFDSTTAVSHLTGSTIIYAPIKRILEGLASGELSTDPIRTEGWFDFVASGVVWSGDAYASTRNASQTSGVLYINGRRLTVAAVTSRSFTASKDTYVDASDNGDGTALLTYTEVTNNAASPALAANSIRLAIIVTGATNIAAAGSVNQGQEDRVLPIASSIAYSVSDSLGNLICPRDPQRKVLGYAQAISSQATISTLVDLTGLSTTVAVTNNRKIKITGAVSNMNSTVSGDKAQLRIYEGATLLNTGQLIMSTLGQTVTVSYTVTPTTGSHTYKLMLSRANGTGTLATNADSQDLASLQVELV